MFRNTRFNEVMAAILAIVMFSTIGFAYTRDWDTADPIDHTLNSRWPAEVREVMVDVGERLSEIMNGFASGETVTNFDKVPMIDQGLYHPGVADTIILQAKDIGGVTELVAVDENDNQIQITDNGSINVAVPSQCETIYPIGSIYIATVATDPSTLLGCGTWASWGEGRVIVGIDSGDTDFDTVEEIGGAKDHALSKAELPPHVHTEKYPNPGLEASSDTTGYDANSATTNTGDGSADGLNGDAHNNLQPYIVAYMWERTS